MHFRRILLVSMAVLAALVGGCQCTRGQWRDPFDRFSPVFKARYLNRARQGSINKRPVAPNQPKWTVPPPSAPASPNERQPDLEFARFANLQDGRAANLGRPTTSRQEPPPSRTAPAEAPQQPPVVVASKQVDALQQDDELHQLKELLDSFTAKLGAANFGQALELADRFEALARPLLEAGQRDGPRQQQVAYALASVLMGKMKALRNSNRLVEALIEGQRLGDLWRTFGGGQMGPLQAQSEAAVDELERELKRAPPLQVLGARTPAEAKQAHKRLVLLLHPDKNQALSEPARQYLASLFVQVRQAFASIRSS